MRRRGQPEPEPEAVDRAHIRRLLDEAAAAHNRGESTHHHPSLEELSELCGPMYFYWLALFPSDYIITDAVLDVIEAAAVRGVP